MFDLFSGHSYCFLSPGPALSAIIIPSIILLVFLSIMSLLVRCIALSHLDSNAQLSDGTQATDLELMDASNIPTERTSLHSVLTPSSQIEDTEHSPLTHLKAFIMTLVIYLLLVISGALTTMTPNILPFEELLFSILYCVFCILLGAFVLFFYCFTRTDVRAGWFKIKAKSKPLYRSRVVDSNNGPHPVLSNSQSLSSNAMKSIATDLNANGGDQRDLFNKSGNSLGLVVLKRIPNSDSHIVNNFYNPQQSTAARKFFKKQRRKQNNTLVLRPHNTDTLNSSILGQSKINNTNIHVDLPVRESKDKNLHERFSDDKPLHNNDGTLRIGEADYTGLRPNEFPGLRPKCNNSEYSEEFVTSQVSESGGEREECSCEGMSTNTYSLGTDCGRDISRNCSSHLVVSDSDVSSHLYATVAPEVADSSLERKSHKRRRDEKKETRL